MTTVLFVHGTGVRAAKFAATFEQVKAGLRTVRDDLAVESCYWGGNGARLWGRGASFYFDPTSADPGQPAGDGPVDIDFDDMDMEQFGARDDLPVPESELVLMRWVQLRADPLFEIRLRQLRGKPRGAVAGAQAVTDLFEPSVTMRDRVLALPGKPVVAGAIAASELTAQFAAAVRWLVGETEFIDVFGTAVNVPGDDERTLARALVARCLASRAAEGVELAGKRRDDLVKAVEAGFGVPDYGVADEAWKLTKRVGAIPVEWGMRRGRRWFIRQFADILLYQAQGKPIRDVLRERILELPEPVVLLAHSLGGVIAFDLLARDTEAELARVKLLVTVGSQVPLLYELRALTSGVGYRSPVPFSQDWLNVYDKQDLLGYAAARFFDGKYRDIEVDTGQPFPMSHGAYWDEKAGLYEHLARELDKAGL
jgi:hypothetical protein